MRRERPRTIGVVVLAAWAFTVVFASVSSDLGQLAPVSLPHWILAVGDVGIGLVLALLLIDMRATFLGLLAAAALGALCYGLLLASPGLVAPAYAVRLTNHATVQAAGVFFLAAPLGLIGVVLGSVINSAVRDIEL